MQTKVLVILAIVATSSLVYGEQAPAIHINYDVSGPVSEFAVQLSGEQVVADTYWAAIGFNGGYCGMQSAQGAEKRMLFSVWNNQYGNSQCLNRNPVTELHSFGGEGTGTQTIVTSAPTSSPGEAALANWVLTYVYTFHLSAKQYGANSTEITLHVFKPELGQWTFFASLLRFDQPGDPSIGKLYGFYSFLEDFSATREQRVGKIHGAWYKNQSGAAWETVKSVRTDHGAEQVAANEYAFLVNEESWDYQEIRYSTGGDVKDPYVNTMYNGPVTFKGPPAELNSVPSSLTKAIRFLSQ